MIEPDPQLRVDDVLVVDGLLKRFGERAAVDDVGFRIARGETYALLGPNGAGKTTAILMICGLLRPDAGTVHVAGRRMDVAATTAKAAVGLVPQEIALYTDLSGRENLRFFGRLQGLSGRRLDERIAEVLHLVGLADRADDPVEDYSGGMQRRCNIAAGLLHRPELLILDEPTVGVDPQSRNQILESIQALGGEGLSVLYTTHYMEEAERLCDRIGIMDEGRLIAEGSRRELISLIEETSHVVVAVESMADGVLADIDALSSVRSVSVAEGRIDVGVEDASSAVGAIIGVLDRHRVAVTDVSVTEPNLETVFLRLTGKALRN